MADKAEIGAKTDALIAMTAAFCGAHLDDECAALCEKLIRKLARKRAVPFLSGTLAVWGGATVHALATINFLFDQSSDKYISADQISVHFGGSKSAIAARAKQIRDTLGLRPFDPEFSTAETGEADPFRDLAVINGIIVPLKMLPPEIKALYEANRG